MRQQEPKQEETLARTARKRAIDEGAETQTPNGEAAVRAATNEPLDESVVAALGAADDKKALDMVVLDVREVASFTDYFLIASGTSTRQVQAIADEVVERLKSAGRRAARVEGYRNAEWVLIDFGDFVFHIFEDKARRFYDLERLWRDAARVELPRDFTAPPEKRAEQ
ncbi:MAG: ribosome-associated protein [Acidobacteriota bacterium]|nr:ribosome-associated protein [Acidobacteriota bacterium]